MDALDTFRQRWLERENRLWDERNGYDTRGWVVPEPDATVSGAADGFPYAGTHVRLASALMRRLQPAAREAGFVDLGAGKGRMLLFAAELPFREVIGVEYSSELHAAGEANLAKLRRSRPDAPVRLELLDVREFAFPATPIVVYMNNPFPEEIFSAALGQLDRSYAAQPRPVSLVYQQLRVEDAEHETRNLELLNEVEFLRCRRLRLPGLATRWLLRQYSVSVYTSTE